MSSLLKRVADGNVAILGILCVMAYLCSAEGQTSNYFSFHITSRRNATGHCLVRAIFNIPEPARPMSNNLQEEQETCFDVQQNINTVENRTIIQLVSTFIGETINEAGYALWHSGQPDRPDEHCGGMSKKDGKLADLPCGASLAYFCEKKL
ncbi:Uncharacterized protein GBIM_10227 [Gryllus bimaculatus]|nr:Uncharacterized protein GBIM_10227 [Gryllus bimaculatus]